MRILNVTQSYAPFFEFGGPPVKVQALSRGLAHRGHSITVLTADWGLEARFSVSSPPSAERCPFGWRVNEENLQTIYLPTWLHYRAVTWNPALQRYCRARLAQFDVVHIFGLYDLLGPGVAKACRRVGLPYVFEPIGMFVPIVRNFTLKRIYHALWGRRLARGAAAVIATSGQEAEELAGAGVPQETIMLRRNGVEVPAHFPPLGSFRAKLGIPAVDRMILFLGRLSQKKSPDMLLEAFASLLSSVDGGTVRLIFAGPDDQGMQTRLRAQAQRLGVAARVHFTGPLFGEEKWSAYRDADVFVLPSQNENFGNTVAEAVAAGTPAVVTDHCGIAPLVDGVAGISVPQDVTQIAHAIDCLLSDSSLREQLRAGCSVAASRLGWDEPVLEMQALYERLASARSR
jgi:glycosyltransferase involved in cell wall biosynthesis